MGNGIHIAEAINQQSWYHSFELLPDVWTPGRSDRIDPAAILDAHGVPRDLSGMVCLDIGTLDGPYAFELARRGAGVIGLDIQRPGATGFDAARAITGSTAEYIQGSAYELTELFDADIFDIVLFLDVWHHMKSPVVAFEQINAVMKKDGLLAAEGECLLNYLETSDDAHMLCQSETPLSIFYPAGYKGDSSSWVVPNAACVNAWLQATGFSKVHAAVEDLSPHQRIRITAVKSSEPKADNPLW